MYGAPARILAQRGDRRQRRDRLAALHDERIVAEAFAYGRGGGSRIPRMCTRQQLKQDCRAVARDRLPGPSRTSRSLPATSAL